MGNSGPRTYKCVWMFPLLGLVIGCQGLQNGSQAWVKPTSEAKQAGNAYLVRGLIGVFSTGMDELSVRLNDAGVRSHVFQDAQENGLADWIIDAYKGAPQSEPLVLIGHSYGADDVVRIARKLEPHNIKVDLMITVDATTPPELPANVGICYNYYQSQVLTDGIPMFRGIPLRKAPGAERVVLYNVDLRRDRKDLLVDGTNHINIDKNPLLHRLLVEQVLGVCPPRDAWVARQGAPQQARPAASVQPPQQPTRQVDTQARTSN
jgi:hypothetical protein